ncbi:hypothetical protein WICPIJ_009290 [Wickerhamomyces pijperi]|uniref:Uncharacterized protein n=1 Tax=Wickerhamomyces pijperi TaxID=599730 RepID=A0A9P8PNW3_WICPI|nr:hypothetical protein WICPIJ_009290 [Wickerhamomyces pijperi]
MKNHWKDTTAMAIMEAQSKERACFFLDKPEYNNPTPGIMIQTRTPARPMKAMLARSNCWFKSTVSESPPAPTPVIPDGRGVAVLSDMFSSTVN